MPIINERVSIFILISAEKIHWGTTWCCEMSQIFKSQGVISEDIVVMFDGMYLQKCEEHCSVAVK